MILILSPSSVWLELKTVFDSLSINPSVRAIIFSGSGEKAFSVGIDLKWASSEDSPFMSRPGENGDPARRAAVVRRFGVEMQDCISSIEKCEKRMYLFFFNTLWFISLYFQYF